jgi:hypothetical protein
MMDRIIIFLRSEACVFLAIMCVMIVQIAHNTFVVFTKSQIESTWLALCFALFYAFAIEFSILTYVINNMRTHAIAYAIASFVTNLFYYYQPDSKVAPVLISAMLAGSIWSFSDLFVKKLNPEKEKKEKEKKDQEEKPKKAFKCDWPGCDATFSSWREKNGHVSAHKRKDNNLHTIKENGQAILLEELK